MLRVQAVLDHGRQRFKNSYKITKIGITTAGISIAGGYVYAKYRPLTEANTKPVKRIDNEITRFFAVFGLVQWLQKDIMPGLALQNFVFFRTLLQFQNLS